MYNKEMATEIAEICEILENYKPEYVNEILRGQTIAEFKETIKDPELSQNALRGKLKLSQNYLHEACTLLNQASFQEEKEINEVIAGYKEHDQKAEQYSIGTTSSAPYSRYVNYVEDAEEKIKDLREARDKGFVEGVIEVNIDLKPKKIPEVKWVEIRKQLITEKRKQQKCNRIQQRYLKKKMKCLANDSDFELFIQNQEEKIKELLSS
jgi:hypothetical protein